MPSMPDRSGHYGAFGGRYVSETLMPALLELEAAYESGGANPRSGMSCAAI